MSSGILQIDATRAAQARTAIRPRCLAVGRRPVSQAWGGDAVLGRLEHGIQAMAPSGRTDAFAECPGG